MIHTVKSDDGGPASEGVSVYYREMASTSDDPKTGFN